MSSDSLNAREVVVAAIEAVRLELQKRGSRPWKEPWPARRVVHQVIFDRLLLVQAALHTPEDVASDMNESRDRRIVEIVGQLLDGPIDDAAAWDVADLLKEVLPDGSLIESEDITARASGSLVTDDPVERYLCGVGRALPLTAEEEISLGKRMEAGRLAKERLSSDEDLSSEERDQLATAVYDGEAALNELIMASTQIAVTVAKEHEGRGVPLADLIQEAKIGLARAASRFDYQRGTRFSPHASLWARQHVAKLIAVQGRMNRLPARPHERNAADYAFEQLSWDQLGNLFASFSLREVLVLQSRFGLMDGRGRTVEEVGMQFGVTPERVRQIEKRALERLYRSGDTGERQGSPV